MQWYFKILHSAHIIIKQKGQKKKERIVEQIDDKSYVMLKREKDKDIYDDKGRASGEREKCFHW